MPSIKDFLPTPPGQGPPLPRFMTRRPTIHTPVKHGHCEYGLSCIKDHMGRSHLYINEAIRFSSAGTITPEARQKVRLSRAELQCEDDFAAAMEAPVEIRAEVLKLLAACRSTWKAMDRSGVDTYSGTLNDLTDILNSVKALWDKAYDIESQYQAIKVASSPR